ncbi:MAG: response regulator [Candidatus Omnitrophica bacterium]|nr:response regulator [Candidatus Omnitrophota bacterium]
MSKEILIVDDDPVVVRLLESVLQGQGYRTARAEDGLDALVKIKQQHPALVILDIIMPEINGYDVCCELRFNQDFEKIPIIIVTEEEQEIDDSVGKRVNIEYLHKPVDPEKLLEKVKMFLPEP